ncbi:hypothetical protein, partial [Streptococcus pyogenes]|uniref:hypothetical protein n=1 Tax=Streptococcus pyogenes TaxID=1314 RepID=UPI001CA33396
MNLRKDLEAKIPQDSTQNSNKRLRIDFGDKLQNKAFVVKITWKTDQSGNTLVVQYNLASFNNETAVTYG